MFFDKWKFEPDSNQPPPHEHHSSISISISDISHFGFHLYTILRMTLRELNGDGLGRVIGLVSR